MSTLFIERFRIVLGTGPSIPLIPLKRSRSKSRIVKKSVNHVRLRLTIKTLGVLRSDMDIKGDFIIKGSD